MRLLIILVTVVITTAFFFAFGNDAKPLHGDALGYYEYLPSTFIYHNLDSVYTTPADKGIESLIYGSLYDTKNQKSAIGYTLNQYTYGVALIEAPFFFIAHAYEKIMGYSANGYSVTYQLLLKIAALFYVLLGLLLVYDILKKYFTATEALLSACVIFLGTNLFWFTIIQAGMSHVLLFFLYALLIWLTIKIYARPKTYLFISAGVVAGLIAVTRPTDILCLLIPLLYNVYNRDTLRMRMKFLAANTMNIAVLVISFIAPIIPQIIYWKVITGHYLYYSYGQQSFNWLHPKIIAGLFYYANGWLAYSPIMIFSLLGLLLYKQYRQWAWCIFAILPVYIYVIYSWWCYNYINGLGSRPMIHLYPLLAIPLTACIHLLSRQKVIYRALAALLFAFFIALNLSYSMQKAKDIITTSGSNIQFNMQTMFHTQLRYEDLVVSDLAIKQPDTGKLTKVCTLIAQGYEDSISQHYVKDTAPGSKYVYHLTGDEEYQQPPEIKYTKAQFKDAKWMKVSGRFMYTSLVSWPDGCHILMISVNNEQAVGCGVENKLAPWKTKYLPGMTMDYYQPDKWGSMYFFIPVPHNITEGESLKIFIWNISRTELYIDDMRLELYK